MADMTAVAVVGGMTASKMNVPLEWVLGEVIEDRVTVVADGMTVIGTEIETGVLPEKGIVDREVL
jgi:hypothetical protein